MAAWQRITTGLGTAVLAVGLVGSLTFAPAAAAGEIPAASGLAAPAPVLDQQSAQSAENRAPGDLAREGMAKMLQALNKLVESIPQYQLPEITENGDIIIRRKTPGAPVPATKQPPQGGPDNRAI
jgi:hypothetical protein